jgi:hypothetical protein
MSRLVELSRCAADRKNRWWRFGWNHELEGAGLAVIVGYDLRERETRRFPEPALGGAEPGAYLMDTLPPLVAQAFTCIGIEGIRGVTKRNGAVSVGELWVYTTCASGCLGHVTRLGRCQLNCGEGWFHVIAILLCTVARTV